MAWDHWNMTPPSQAAPVNGDVSANVVPTGELREVRSVTWGERLAIWDRIPKIVQQAIVWSLIAVAGVVASQVNGWAQDIADQAALKAVEAHEAKGAHPEAATKKDLEGITLILTKMDAKLDGIVEDTTASKTTEAILLCRTLPKTQVKHGVCVLKKHGDRAKRLIKLVDIAALRLEVQGL